MASSFVPFNRSEYLKLVFNLELQKCISKDDVTNCSVSSRTTAREETLSGLSWIQHVLDKSWLEYVASLVLDMQQDNSDEEDCEACTSIRDWTSEIEFDPNFWIVIFFIVMVSLVLPLVLYKISNIIETCQSKPKEPNTNLSQNNVMKMPGVLEDSECHASGSGNQITNGSAQNDAELLYRTINLFSIPYRKKEISGINKSSDIEVFLKRTVECLFSELDKFLIDPNSRPGNSSPPLHSVVSAGRTRPSRNTLRATGRLNSSPSLQQETRNDSPKEILAWQEFQQKVVYGHGLGYTFDDIDTKGDSSTPRLLQYYRQHCSVAYEQHAAASLIVTYSLILLEKVLKSLGPINGLRFLKFSNTGSMETGLKVTEANQFDTHMVFQCSDFECHKVVDHFLCNEIQPGKICICAKSAVAAHKLLKTHVTRSESLLCLSSQEYSSTAGYLLDTGIQKLYTETRSLIDRLPFKIHRASIPGLILVLDTRSVIGLGLAEIKMQLIPSFPLPVSGWIQPSITYAVPTWTNLDLKRKPSSQERHGLVKKSNFPYDLTWCISYGELEEVYLRSVDLKFEQAGMSGCYRVCLKILKALFAPLSRKSLLSKGEVSPYILQTVVFFLLLESSVKQWSFDRLIERFSDSVIFLQQALRNERLPNFFVNNPLLAKHMPFVNSIPFLVRGRQENLLSDMSSNSLEKMLSYIDSRLIETGMKECVREDYSEDMMEYEYFVYL